MLATLLLAAASVAAPASGASAAAATFEDRMLELVNGARAAVGIAPVQASIALAGVAGASPYQGCGYPVAGRSADMGARNYFSHTILNCGGQAVGDMLKAAGLPYPAVENIAWVSAMTDPLMAAERLHNDLMASPAHRANILDPRFTQVGIGSWTTGAGQSWSGAGTPLTRVWITAQVFAQVPLTSAPAMSASPTSLSFGEAGVGASAGARTVTVTNGGSAPITISATSVGGANPGDFTVASNTCGPSVAPGASCSVGVDFKPGGTGPRSASLAISHNAAGSPQVVTLAGSGASALTGAPTTVVATGGDGQLGLSWAAPTSGPAPSGYGVWVYDGAGYTGTWVWACGTCTTALATGLTNGRQYYAAVYGYNGTAWGGGAASGPVWVLAVPGAPVNAKAAPGDGSVSLTWGAPTTTGAGVDGFGVFLYDSRGYTGRSMWVCATCGGVTISGLANGQAYYPVIYSHNANGWGATTSPGWVTPAR
ncbi:MAG: hypothetical protein QOJ92_3058 [Frankiales bacterium]|nr:hypothetical protein [Frankiales bacterium]